ncbi:MAG TPA: glycosyltransferase family 2 protein [Candidatus Lustribacter sp.]|nr:glycosyltransferase family 2 protein [Candidatus Lustribacter sp.]
MIGAYGPSAQRYAQGLGDIEAIVTEPAYVLSAYVEAARRRFAGELFYGMLLLEENHDRVLTAFAPAVLAQTQDDDRRRWLLNNVNSEGVSINGRPGREVLAEPILTPEAIRLAREFLNLCPAVLVRSALEYERISAALLCRRPFEVVVLEPPLPEIERRVPDRPGVVIWAPERDVHTAAVHAFALAEVHGKVTLVSADGLAPPGTRVTALRAADPRVVEALATAGSVVLTDATDPGTAIAFARRGYGIVAPVSSGAHEFVRNAHLYDPAVQREVHVATMKSLAEPASLRALPLPPARVPEPAPMPVEVAAAPPLVTAVIPTFNRREDIERCLTCLGAQSYPNVRAVVVNDAGVAIDDIVARFPFARLLNLAQNGGTIRAVVEGMKLVDDGYMVFFADDDWLFPDHFDRLVTAMVRSGAVIAHSNVLIRYVERVEGGIVKTTGYNAGVFIDTAAPSEALVGTPIAGHGVLWHHSVFDDIGGWREDSALADQEIQMRASRRHAFVWVDQMTAEWRVHSSNFSRTADSLGEQRRIYEELHPVNDRPLITQVRNNTLERMALRPPGYVFEPTFSLVEPVDL